MHKAHVEMLYKLKLYAPVKPFGALVLSNPMLSCIQCLFVQLSMCHCCLYITVDPTQYKTLFFCLRYSFGVLPFDGEHLNLSCFDLYDTF